MVDKKGKLVTGDNETLAEQNSGDVLFDYENITDELWLKNIYFQDCFKNTFGKKIAKIIFSTTTNGYISPKEYNKLIDACGNSEIESLTKGMDLELINSGYGISRKLTEQNIIDIGLEMQIAVHQLIMRYKIFDDILSGDRYTNDYQLIEKTDDFEIVLHKETDVFYLKTGDSLYVKHHVFGNIENGSITMSHLMFEGEGETHIYDYSKKQLLTFDGEYKFAYTVYGVDYILMESPSSGSTVYGMQNGIEFQKTATVMQMLEHGNDVFIVYAYGERSTSKVGKNKTRIDSYVGIYSLSQGETIHEFDGANIEVEGVILGPEGFALNLHEKKSHTTMKDSIMREYSSLYYFDNDSSPNGVSDITAKLNFGKDTNFDVHITRSDIIVISHHKVNNQNGKNTDTHHISNIHSLSGKLNISKIREIIDITLANGILEITYTDTTGEKGYYNSEYAYLLKHQKQPTVLPERLN